MRALVQRVKKAEVSVDEEIVGSIQEGLLVFLGIHKDDTKAQVRYLVPKIADLRIFADNEGKMNLSLRDKGLSVLVVSQFTLYGDCSNGRRPDFFSAMKGEEAAKLYQLFIEEFLKENIKVETGRFQAYMQVSLINDGPITILVETPVK